MSAAAVASLVMAGIFTVSTVACVLVALELERSRD
jgi:hypothetical protein